MARPFRFGFTAFPVMTARAAWVEDARRAEAAGFAVLTVTDHFTTASGTPRGGVWSALMAAWSAAPALRVGTMLLNNDVWNPAVIAREALTMDVLTDGRFELGLGAGWDPPDFRIAGIPQDPPARRIERLAASVSLIKGALAGEPLRDAALLRPVQPRVPLILGGGGRRVLELAAREADTVSINRNLKGGSSAGSWRTASGAASSQEDEFSARVEWVRAAAGPRTASLELHSLLLRAVVTDRRHDAAAGIGAPFGLTGEAVLASPHFVVGTVAQIADDLHARRERWGFSYWTLTERADLEAFGAVITRVAGR